VTSLRKINYYKHHYLEFFNLLNKEVQGKLNRTLILISTLQRVPEKYFKHIRGSDGLYEIRTEVGSNIYRVLCFCDEGHVIIWMNGFQKKTQKTPRREIAMANKLKAHYLHEKES
jgi:phage-related protein